MPVIIGGCVGTICGIIICAITDSVLCGSLVSAGVAIVVTLLAAEVLE